MQDYSKEGNISLNTFFLSLGSLSTFLSLVGFSKNLSLVMILHYKNEKIDSLKKVFKENNIHASEICCNCSN